MRFDVMFLFIGFSMIGMGLFFGFFINWTLSIIPFSLSSIGWVMAWSFRDIEEQHNSESVKQE